MGFVTIFLFFVLLWGLGFSVARFVKESDNWFEKNLMRLGFGLGVFPILSIILNFLHIPLDWKIFLFLALIFPVYYLVENKKLSLPKFKLTKSNITIFVVLLIFLATFFMYHKGAFAYPWLEDSDPYAHASAAKYVSLEKNAFEPIPGTRLFHYIDPYPPSYDILMGILHQTSESLSWTLKFFNALIISLGIFFFFFFAKQFTRSRNKALFSTFVLAAIPCYLSHFIWAHVLIVTLIFPTFYALEKIKDDKRFKWLSLLLIASLMVIQPTQQAKIGILIGIYWGVHVLLNKNLQKHILTAAVGGLLLSLVFWWGPMYFKYGGVSGILGDGFGFTSDPTSLDTKDYFGIAGTATRLYTFNDFFIAQPQNMINNPVGVGIFISLLLMLSMIYIIINFKKLFNKDNPWLLITSLWLVFTFLGIHGGTRIPIALISFRFWMLFAIPVAIISSEGAWWLFRLGRKVKIPALLILIILVGGILGTSAYQKYSVNTAQWPYGGTWSSIEEFGAYLWILDLPANTKVFALYDGRKEILLGFDKYNCPWCEDEISFRKTAFNKSASQINSWLKSRDYKYFVMEASLARVYGVNETNIKIAEIAQSFPIAHQTNAAIVFEIK